MPEPYSLHAYSIDELRRLLVERANADPSVIDAKTHLTYFESYFKELGAQTILVENAYIDRDFLEDFAAYYVRCFQEYARTCTRLHFFSIAFGNGEFAALLRGEASPLSADILQEAYLGFVVVKPLPQTVIGRTCLKTYPPDNERRRYPITRRYAVHLFGIELSVESLAFQEQDSVVAACATSALWSAFQGTGVLFQHAIPSPVEITRAANAGVATNSRFLPNRGLSAEQMALAIRSVGLEPLMLGTLDPYATKSNLYAYLRGRVPALMVGALWEVSPGAAHAVHLGNHAVAVTGFSAPTTGPRHAGPNGFQSAACCIDRIYVHDDQVGPFARMVFDGVEVVPPPPNSQPRWSLGTAWRTTAPGTSGVRFTPQALLVPVYHKIRIPFATIHNIVLEFDELLELVRGQMGAALLSERVIWKMHLDHLGNYKHEVLNDTSISADVRYSVLTEALPRFLWRARAECAGKPVCDVLFDATDIEQGRVMTSIVRHDAHFALALKTLLTTPGGQLLIASASAGGRDLLKHFAA